MQICHTHVFPQTKGCSESAQTSCSEPHGYWLLEVDNNCIRETIGELQVDICRVGIRTKLLTCSNILKYPFLMQRLFYVLTCHEKRNVGLPSLFTKDKKPGSGWPLEDDEAKYHPIMENFLLLSVRPENEASGGLSSSG